MPGNQVCEVRNVGYKVVPGAICVLEPLRLAKIDECVAAAVADFRIDRRSDGDRSGNRKR
jgi:hypothetical protein